MTRRRLVLVVAAAAVVAGAGWWLSLDRLSAEERPLVGTWAYEDWDKPGVMRTAVFGPDRVCVCPTDAAPRGDRCSWSVRGGAVVFDYEPSRLRRLLRPVAPLLGLAVKPALPPYRVEVAGDRMIITDPGGTPTVFTRAPTDEHGAGPGRDLRGGG
ncbi:MAG TPA: hypothetical protein VGF55_08470 [Gemmataceae bacterium]|jgi:hypothetical protein